MKQLNMKQFGYALSETAYIGGIAFVKEGAPTYIYRLDTEEFVLPMSDYDLCTVPFNIMSALVHDVNTYKQNRVHPEQMKLDI